jgi:hypothetical protein
VQCGLTFGEAIDHTLPQLQAMARAATRLQARQALITLDVMHVAAAACWSPKGGSALQKLRKTFTDIQQS